MATSILDGVTGTEWKRVTFSGTAQETAGVALV